jgi:hypothetical protein
MDRLPYRKMNLIESVFSIFSGLSRLYPKEYQQKYSEDMKSVFREILEDSGGWHAIRALLRECFSLPGCLVREYLSISEGGSMKTTRQILAATMLGFFFLFFLFAIERILFRFLFAQEWADQPRIFLLELIIDGTISGILVGGAIGFAISIKNKVAMMAVCGLGFIAGRVLTGPIYWKMLGIPTAWVNSEWETFCIYAALPVTGFFVGGFAGLLWKGLKSGIVFGLASSLIFTVGLIAQLLAQNSIWNLLFDQGIMQTVDPNSLSDNLRLLIGMLISYSILGGIVGILWGILLDRLPRMKSLKLSGAGS